MRHPVAGGPLRHNCVSFKRVDRLTVERGQCRVWGGNNKENRGSREHVSGEGREAKRQLHRPHKAQRR